MAREENSDCMACQGVSHCMTNKRIPHCMACEGMSPLHGMQGLSAWWVSMCISLVTQHKGHLARKSLCNKRSKIYKFLCLKIF